MQCFFPQSNYSDQLFGNNPILGNADDAHLMLEWHFKAWFGSKFGWIHVLKSPIKPHGVGQNVCSEIHVWNQAWKPAEWNDKWKNAFKDTNVDNILSVKEQKIVSWTIHPSSFHCDNYRHSAVWLPAGLSDDEFPISAESFGIHMSIQMKIDIIFFVTTSCVKVKIEFVTCFPFHFEYFATLIHMDVFPTNSVQFIFTVHFAFLQLKPS